MAIGGIAQILSLFLLNFPKIGYFLWLMTIFFQKLCPFPLKHSTHLVLGGRHIM